MPRIPVIAYQGNDERFDVKLYYQVNKEKIKERRKVLTYCECCKRDYSIASYSHHIRSDKHNRNKREMENMT
jgi:hypothetical protein